MCKNQPQEFQKHIADERRGEFARVEKTWHAMILS